MSESNRREPLPWFQAAQVVCEDNGLPGAIVVMRQPNGSYTLSVYGMSHAEGVDALAVGIHMVLAEHDKRVLAGDAGPQAQQLAEAIQALQDGEG